MEFETIKGGSKKKIIIGVIVFCVLGVVVTFATTRAKYRNTESIPLVRGTINYSRADMSIIAMYDENDNELSEMPESGYTINEDKSYCNVNGEKDTNVRLYTNASGEHVMSKLKKGSKCYLYFDAKPMTKDDILAGLTKANRGSITGPLTASSTKTVYSAADDDGTSYYYAGAATDNYVRFAGKYWRIIRFNGDGTIRLIYAGTTAIGNGVSDASTQTGTSTFNSSYNNNVYVGYMYTSGQVHGLGTESTIKGVLDNWYNSNLASYADKIDPNAGFCNDRQPSTNQSTSNGSGGTGTTATYYGAYIRILPNGSWANPQVPTFRCTNSSDLFTKSGATKGNKALTNPIGLITADEVVYAGGFGGSINTSYYLYTGQTYWTMSPWNFTGSIAYVFFVNSDGSLGGSFVNYAIGVRPVINLKANTLFATGGTGTSSNPYVVE